MIFDRTMADVYAADDIRKNKLGKGIPLTNEDYAVLERGTLTINTITRIEDKQSYLKSLLNNMGYYNISISNKTWSYGDFFVGDDLKRLIKNSDVLREAFFVYSNTPLSPRAEYNYREINSLEKILYDLEEMIKFVKQNYAQCGTLSCGEN